MKLTRAGEQSLDLKLAEAIALRPGSAVGSAQARDAKQALSADVLARINELFADEDFSPGQQQSWIEAIVTVLEEGDSVRLQAAANAVTVAVMSTGEAYRKMSERFFASDAVLAEITRAPGRIVREDTAGNRRG